MLRLVADEDFNHRIVRGVRRKQPDLDIVRVQELGLSGAPDPELLEWAANEDRLILTHDASTMTRYAYERVVNNLPMPGVFPRPIAWIIDQGGENPPLQCAAHLFSATGVLSSSAARIIFSNVINAGLISTAAAAAGMSKDRFRSGAGYSIWPSD